MGAGDQVVDHLGGVFAADFGDGAGKGGHFIGGKGRGGWKGGMSGL